MDFATQLAKLCFQNKAPFRFDGVNVIVYDVLSRTSTSDFVSPEAEQILSPPTGRPTVSTVGSSPSTRHGVTYTVNSDHSEKPKVEKKVRKRSSAAKQKRFEKWLARSKGRQTDKAEGKSVVKSDGATQKEKSPSPATSDGKWIPKKSEIESPQVTTPDTEAVKSEVASDALTEKGQKLRKKRHLTGKEIQKVVKEAGTIAFEDHLKATKGVNVWINEFTKENADFLLPLVKENCYDFAVHIKEFCEAMDQLPERKVWEKIRQLADHKTADQFSPDAMRVLRGLAKLEGGAALGEV